MQNQTIRDMIGRISKVFFCFIPDIQSLDLKGPYIQDNGEIVFNKSGKKEAQKYIAEL